jgi:lipopolysaccharide export system permease protein
MRLRLLSRYILRQYLSNLVLGLLVFTFVLLLDKFFELVDLIVNKGAGLWLAGKMLMLLLPTSLSLTLPISNLLAALLTYGHLSETNEITAARASGIATWDLAWAPIATAAISVLFLLPFNTQWAPQAQSKFRQIYVQLLERNPLVRIEEKTFSDVGDYHMYVEKKRNWRNPPLRGITIYKTPQGGAPLRIFAEGGTAHVDREKGMWLILENGHMQEINPTQPQRWFYTTFKTYEFFIAFEGQKQNSSKSIQEMDTRELWRAAKELRAQGLPYPLYTAEIQLRLAMAVTPILFVLLGVPLAMRVRRGGRSIGFGLSLGILVIYYVMIMGGIGMAQRGSVPAIPAVWFANAVLALAGAGLCWLQLKE